MAELAGAEEGLLDVEPDDLLLDLLWRAVPGAATTWTTTWADGGSTLVDPELVGGQRSIFRQLDGRGRAVVERYTGVLTDLTEVKTDYDPLDQPMRVRETRGSGDVTATYAYGDERRLLTGITRGTESITCGRTASGQLEYATSPAGTAMLENGADIRFIQEMLGHAKLTSTQVYTRVSIAKLKAVHTATHPAALLERRLGALNGDGAPPHELDE